MRLKNKISFPAVLLPVLASFALAWGMLFMVEVPAFTFLERAFRPRPQTFFFFVSLSALTLCTFWLLYSLIVSRLHSRPFEEILKHDALTYLPLVLTALAPLTLSHFLTAADALARTRLLMGLSFFLVVYLKIVQFREWRRENARTAAVRRADPSKLSLRKKLIALFAASIVFTNLGSLLMIGNSIGFSGDEPHYLLICHSLLHDGDLDLADNYARKDYHAFTRESVTIPQLHVIQGKKPGSQFSFHSPGTAFLMLPFYAVGSAFGKTGLILWLRFGMSLFGALFGLQVFLLIRDIWANEKRALMLWLLTSLAAPVYFYSLHIYPEIIVAFSAIVVFRFLRRPVSLTRSHLLLCGFLLSTFIWFHALKYIFLSVPLLVYGFWVLSRKRSGSPDYVSFIALPVVMTMIYLFFQNALYGSFSITAVSIKGSLETRGTLAFVKELFTRIPFRFRWETLADYFFDQRDGLLFYTPIYFFSFLGFVDMARKKTGEFLCLLFATAPFVLVHAFLTQRGSYAPQARPLMPVIWALIIGVGWFLERNRKRFYSGLFVFSSAVGLAVTWLLLRDPLSLYQETTVGVTERGGRLFYLLSNLHFHLTDILPSYIKSGEGAWPPNWIWLAIFLVFLAGYALGRRSGPARPASFATHMILGLAGGTVFFFWLVFYPRTILYAPENVSFPTGKKITFYSMSRAARQIEPGSFQLLENDRSYVFSMTSRRKIRNFRFEFGSPGEDYETGLNYFDAPLDEGRTGGKSRALNLPDPPPYTFKNSHLYIVTFRLKRISGGRTAENPFLFRIVPSG